MVWGAPRGVQDIVERLQKNDATLQSLCLLRQRRFEEADARLLCETLAHNTVLQELNISSHIVTPAMAAVFADLLSTSTTLQNISLGNSTFGNEAGCVLLLYML